MYYKRMIDLVLSNLSESELSKIADFIKENYGDNILFQNKEKTETISTKIENYESENFLNNPELDISKYIKEDGNFVDNLTELQIRILEKNPKYIEFLRDNFKLKTGLVRSDFEKIN